MVIEVVMKGRQMFRTTRAELLPAFAEEVASRVSFSPDWADADLACASQASTSTQPSTLDLVLCVTFFSSTRARSISDDMCLHDGMQ